jgi:acylphosphatase
VNENKTAKRYYVSGLVQGVGYRYFAQRTARGLALAGYARNLSDGRVEVYAIGPDSSLATLRTELMRGPRGSEVSSVTEEEAASDAQFAESFSIEDDA